MSMSTPAENQNESAQDNNLDQTFPWKPWGCAASLLVVFLIYLVITAVSVWPWLWGMAGYADFLCGLDTPSNDTCLPETAYPEIRDYSARLVVRVGGTHYNWYGGGCWSEEIQTGPASTEVRGHRLLSLERQEDALLVNGHLLQAGEVWQVSGFPLWSPLSPWFIERESINIRNNGVFDCVATRDGNEVQVNMLYVTGEIATEGLRLTLCGLIFVPLMVLALMFCVAKIRQARKAVPKTD